MTKKNETTTEAPQEGAPKKEVKKRGRKPGAKKPQKKVDETSVATEPQEITATKEKAAAVNSEAQKEVKKPVRKARSPRKKQEVKPEEKQVEETTEQTKADSPEPVVQEVAEPTVAQEAPAPAQPAPAPVPQVPAPQQPTPPQPREIKVLPLPNITIHNIVELYQAPQRAIILTDQQIQTLTLEEIEKRHKFLEETLANILDYDVVISDTNIWLELLIGHTSSHSDPRYNARLQFERQLEFISRFSQFRGGRFMMMGETYEEIDRFASMQDPTNHREADWTDNIVCLNTAARLAKRLILAQQKENRLRIEGIGAESHHAAFADPAIVRKVAELFAQGKKVLLLTNDASVAIRSLGICDDLQRHNNISDKDWDELYAPLRPMVFTFDDLKLLDYYTRQYHYIQMAAGQPWMTHIDRSMNHKEVTPLTLWQDAFRPGDKHRGDNLFTEQEQKQVQQQQKQKQEQQKQQNQSKQQQKEKQQKQQEQQKPQEPVANPAESAEPTTEQEQKPAAKPRQKSRRRPQKQKQNNLDQPKQNTAEQQAK